MSNRPLSRLSHMKAKMHNSLCFFRHVASQVTGGKFFVEVEHGSAGLMSIYASSCHRGSAPSDDYRC